MTRRSVPPPRHGLCRQLGAEPIKFRLTVATAMLHLPAKARLASPLTVEVEAKAKELAVTRLMAGLHGEGASHAR